MGFKNVSSWYFDEDVFREGKNHFASEVKVDDMVIVRVSQIRGVHKALDIYEMYVLLVTPE